MTLQASRQASSRKTRCSLSHRPPDPLEMAARAVQVVSDRAAAVGLTSIHDVWAPWSSSWAEDMRAYQDAYQRGWLKIRVQMASGSRQCGGSRKAGAFKRTHRLRRRPFEIWRDQDVCGWRHGCTHDRNLPAWPGGERQREPRTADMVTRGNGEGPTDSRQSGMAEFPRTRSAIVR